jgi:hypothetical protein
MGREKKFLKKISWLGTWFSKGIIYLTPNIANRYSTLPWLTGFTDSALLEPATLLLPW